MNRQEIYTKREENSQKIEALRIENLNLERQAILLCDETQRFEEKFESHPKEKHQKKPFFLDGKLVGRKYWKEDFKDEDTGDIVTIERNEIVRVDGVWC